MRFNEVAKLILVSWTAWIFLLAQGAGYLPLQLSVSTATAAGNAASATSVKSSGALRLPTRAEKSGWTAEQHKGYLGILQKFVVDAERELRSKGYSQMEIYQLLLAPEARATSKELCINNGFITEVNGGCNARTWNFDPPAEQLNLFNFEQNVCAPKKICDPMLFGWNLPDTKPFCANNSTADCKMYSDASMPPTNAAFSAESIGNTIKQCEIDPSRIPGPPFKADKNCADVLSEFDNREKTLAAFCDQDIGKRRAPIACESAVLSLNQKKFSRDTGAQEKKVRNQKEDAAHDESVSANRNTTLKGSDVSQKCDKSISASSPSAADACLACPIRAVRKNPSDEPRVAEFRNQPSQQWLRLLSMRPSLCAIDQKGKTPKIDLKASEALSATADAINSIGTCDESVYAMPLSDESATALSAFGADEKAITKIICSTSASEAQAVIDSFSAQFDLLKSLSTDDIKAMKNPDGSYKVDGLRRRLIGTLGAAANKQQLAFSDVMIGQILQDLNSANRTPAGRSETTKFERFLKCTRAAKSSKVASSGGPNCSVRKLGTFADARAPFAAILRGTPGAAGSNGQDRCVTVTEVDKGRITIIDFAHPGSTVDVSRDNLSSPMIYACGAANAAPASLAPATDSRAH